MQIIDGRYWILDTGFSITDTDSEWWFNLNIEHQESSIANQMNKMISIHLYLSVF